MFPKGRKEFSTFFNLIFAYCSIILVLINFTYVDKAILTDLQFQRQYFFKKCLFLFLFLFRCFGVSVKIIPKFRCFCFGLKFPFRSYTRSENVFLQDFVNILIWLLFDPISDTRVRIQWLNFLPYTNPFLRLQQLWILPPRKSKI